MLAASSSHLNAQLMERNVLQSRAALRLLFRHLASSALMETVVGYQLLELTLLDAKSSELAQMLLLQTLPLADFMELTASPTEPNVLIEAPARATPPKLLATPVELMVFASSLPILADNGNALTPLPQTRQEVSLPTLDAQDSQQGTDAPPTELHALPWLLALHILQRLGA